MRGMGEKSFVIKINNRHSTQYHPSHFGFFSVFLTGHLRSRDQTTVAEVRGRARPRADAFPRLSNSRTQAVESGVTTSRARARARSVHQRQQLVNGEVPIKVL